MEELLRNLKDVYNETYFTKELELLREKSAGQDLSEGSEEEGAVKKVSTNKLGGVFAIPSASSSYLWFGVIFCDSGWYQGAVYRFILEFSRSENYFDESTYSIKKRLPALTFVPGVKPIHPLVHPDKGTIDLTKYTKKKLYVWEILKFLKKIFQNPNVYMESISEITTSSLEDHKKKIEVNVSQSIKYNIFLDLEPYTNAHYGRDPNFIKFSKNFDIHKHNLNYNQPKEQSKIGLSFVDVAQS